MEGDIAAEERGWLAASTSWYEFADLIWRTRSTFCRQCETRFVACEPAGQAGAPEHGYGRHLHQEGLQLKGECDCQCDRCVARASLSEWTSSRTGWSGLQEGDEGRVPRHWVVRAETRSMLAHPRFVTDGLIILQAEDNGRSRQWTTRRSSC